MTGTQIKSTVNIFTGLVTDLDPANKVNNSKYNYAENVVLSENGNIGSISNANDFDVIMPFDFNYDLVSHMSLPDFTVLAFKTDDNTMVIYKYTINNLVKVATITGNFAGCKHISLESSIESDNIQRLYIADGINSIMSLDLLSDNASYMTNDISINKKYSSSVSILPSIVSGNLLTGKYFYALKAISRSGSISSTISTTNGIIIKKDSINGGYIDAETDRHVHSKNGIRLSVNIADSNINAIALYRVYFESSIKSPSVNLIYINNVLGDTVEINDINHTSIITDDIYASVFYTQDIVASVLSKKDNILIAGDIRYNIGIFDDFIYDVRAFQFDRNGKFVYHNSNSNSIIELRRDSLSQDLVGKDTDDFIADDIYDNVRYRDVNHRYLDPSSGLYGGYGVNVEYEFCNANLVAAGEGERRNKIFSDLYKNNSSPQYRYNEENTRLINILRDDLTVKFGDKIRDIMFMPIKTQAKSHYDIVDIKEFGIPHHKGKFDYSNELMASVFSGYKRNEIYRFGCKFTFDDGTSTNPMWISDIRFPANYISVTEETDLGFTGNVYSFSAFEAPEDTIDGYWSFNAGADKKTFDVNPLPWYDPAAVDIFKSELIVKPLGLKFRFNNLDLFQKRVVKIDVMYTPMDYSDRSILGQFAVSRIGKFSNTGVPNDASVGADEGSCAGYSYPHPTLSMKHSYGIGPMVMYYGEINNTNKKFSSFSLGFDGYKESIRCTKVMGDLGSSPMSISYDQPNFMTSMPHTTSPYFSDFKNYFLVSPEISYFGETIFDFIRLGDSLSFENLIYPKATMPWVKNHNTQDTTANKALLHIPVLGGPTSGPYNVSGNDIGLDGAWSKNIGLSLSTLGIPSSISRPSLMYSGSVIPEDREYSAEIDKNYVYLSLCGSINSLLLNKYNISQDAHGTQNLFKENVFISSNENIFDCNVKAREDSGFEYAYHEGDIYSDKLPITIKTFMSGIGYMSSFVRRTSIGSPLISIGDGAFNWKTGFSTKSQNTVHEAMPSDDILSVNEKGRFFDTKTNIGLFTNEYHLNAVTFKYFKSSLYWPSNYTSDSSNKMTRLAAVSFIWQLGDAYNDSEYNGPFTYDNYFNYNPGADYNKATEPYNKNTVENVWDLRPLKISVDKYIPIQSEPTGPFDLSQSHGAIRLVNYSKTLSHNITGSKFLSGSGQYYLLSPWWFEKGRPVHGGKTNPDNNKYFTSMNLLNRGRISGKHGAGILIKVDGRGLTGTIPMIGHIGVYHSSTRRFAESSYASNVGLDDPLFRIDQAVSTHNSTFIVDIRKQPNLKSLASYNDKRNSKYIYTAQSIGVVADGSTSKNLYVFGGDTYVTLFDYTNNYPTYVSPGPSATTSGPIISDYKSWNTRYYIDQQVKINSLIPMESFINTHVDAGFTNRKNMNPWDTDKPGMLPVNNGYSSPSVNRPFRDMDEYVYDSSYSAKRSFDMIQLSLSFDKRFNDNRYKSRVIASELKNYGEMIDSFALFKPNNYIDLDPSSGPITSLQTPLNRLYALQPGAISYLSLNDRSLIKDNTGAQLILGTGGVLPYAQKLSSNYGLYENSMNFIRKINDRIYFFDDKLKSICAFPDNVTSLSENFGVSELIKGYSSDETSSVFPAYNNDHAMFRFSNGRILMYNIKMQAFESLYTGDLRYGFDVNKSNYFIGNKVFTKHSTASFGISKMSDVHLNIKLNFICNHDFINTKTFDGVNINLSSTHYKTIDLVKIYHKYSNSIQDTGDYEQLSGINREGFINSPIPRSNANNEKTSRMRDKYIQSMYRFECLGNEISIPYIKTNFRYSYI